ncbi:Cloroperoxidase [Macrolepiota fuliginosa MF-IS2]|uniref:Cloroperoxidase n=1 Tax=Macrolepiota fuliginosa MF-IS2 TaxID=1400762 RepID=A0A9P6BXC5_9AGAR|nr:Cloroperoxidase [Macrolepiota fuliginosa MF-IS2]KAF9444953.1 Cloroperoxidase [Macrolepiota fuliginosa MF-IS2]
MVSFVNFVSLALALASTASAFPAYGSLAGLTREQLDVILPRLEFKQPTPPPGPPKDTGVKLINDAAHPWKAPGPSDIRGPCPGLNTLANHGYLPRNGVASPAQIITAVQEGFNMENSFARFVTYSAHLIDGNLVTDLLSIGQATNETGPAPPAPALAAGLDTHALFEGDASMTRADAYWGDNHSFNQTLFNELMSFMDKYGNGRYNLTVASEIRWQRIQDSMSTNPTFGLIMPRFFTAYAETTFPINFFVDGRMTGTRSLSKEDAQYFFQRGQFPDGWHRHGVPSSTEGMDTVVNAHPIRPGSNTKGVNTYTADPTSADLSPEQFCLIYVNFVNRSVKSLYPNPTGVLLKVLNINLQWLYDSISEQCPGQQQFPYGNSTTQ